MTGIGLISRRYASALAEYSAGLGEEDRVYAQLLPLSERYDYVPEVRETVLSPVVSVEEKTAVISALFEGGPCRSLRDFILLVLRHRREAYFYFILHSFIALYRDRHHIKEAVLTTAAALGENVRDAVRRFRVQDGGHVHRCERGVPAQDSAQKAGGQSGQENLETDKL